MTNQRSRLEARIADLVAAYADLAPTDVDPMAMTRLAASTSAGGPWRSPLVARPPAGLAFVLLVVALAAALVAGALVAGARPFRRDPVQPLTGRVPVEPFVGVAPEGLAASAPETGRLVLAFGGRVTALGLGYDRVWLYEDGRLITVREHREPSGLVERWLTPDGVALMRFATIRAGLSELGDGEQGEGSSIHSSLPGVLWGGLQLADGARSHDMRWSDPDLPERLIDPESWLPAEAWADGRVGGYVPPWYEVCGWPVDPTDAVLSRSTLMSRIGDTLESTAVRLDPPDPYFSDDCPYKAPLDVARSLADMLDESGVAREVGAHSVGYLMGGLRVWLLPVLPDGEVPCECG